MDINLYNISTYTKEIYEFMNLFLKNQKEDTIHILENKQFELGILISKLLNESIITKKPHSVDTLKNIFQKYCESRSEVDFKLQDLIDEGWIRIICNEWFLNVSTTSRITKIDVNDLDNKYKERFMFLKKLCKVNYDERRKIILHNPKMIIKNYSMVFEKTPRYEWFEQKQIIIKEKNKYVLNVRSSIIEPYINEILANYWSFLSYKCIDKNVILLKWLDCRKLFNRGYEFFRFLSIEEQNEFLDLALKQVIKEKDLGDWNKEINIINSKRYLDNPNFLGNPEVKFRIPKNEFEKLYKLDDINDSLFYISRPRNNIDFLFSLILQYSKNYYDVNLKSIVDAIPKKAYLYYFILTNSTNLTYKLIPLLISNKETFLLGCATLLHIDYSKTNIRDEFQIWDRFEKLIIYYLNNMTINDKFYNTINLALIFVNKGRLNLESNNITNFNENMFYRNKYNKFIFTILNKLDIFENGNSLSAELLNDELSNNEVTLDNPYIYIILTLIKDYNKKCPKNQYDQLLEVFYKIYINAISKENTSLYDLQKLNKEIIQNQVWVDIVKKFSENPKKLQGFLEAVSFDLDKKIITVDNEDTYKVYSMKLDIEYKILYHLLMLSNIIILGYDSKILDKTLINKVAQSINNYIIRYQDPENGIDILSVERAHNLNSDYIIEKIMKCVNYLDGTLRDEIILNLSKEIDDLFKIIRIYEFLTRKVDKEIFEKILIGRLDELSIENLCYIPQIQNLIQKLTEFKNDKILNKACEIIKEYEQMLRGGQLDKNLKWINSIKVKINYMKESSTTVLEADSDFYKGLVFFDQKQYERAIDIFINIIVSEPNNLSAKINLLCSYIRLIVEGKKQIYRNKDILESIQIISRQLLEAVESDMVDRVFKKIYYENILYLYYSINDYKSFWKYVDNIEREIKYTKFCGIHIVNMLERQGDKDKAEQFMAELFRIYGTTDEDLNDIKMNSNENNKLEIYKDLTQIESILFSLSSIGKLDLSSKAKIYYYSKDNVSIEQMLLRMLLRACHKLTSYAPNLITKDKNEQQISNKEDTYSLLLKEFFNAEYEQYFNILMQDQSRAGFTGNIDKYGRVGMGELDLRIMNNNKEISIIEALNLDSCDTNNIKLHINKIFGYDINGNVVNFVLIYGTSKNPDKLWKKYELYLKNEFRNDCLKSNINYKFIEAGIVKELDLFKEDNYIKDYETPYKLLYSKHENEENGFKGLLIHIFVDVMKFQNQDTADKSRTK
ncbi:hypothetical protein [Clostridium butyricum]|uniref:hypothetical protein n=1 Tax=Clostridium butyricum TaxID=1492 RepID=UPI00374F7BAD